ncbi:hypothetical protein DTL42_07200 [Bremerella cremea]|uniref:Uncharacterized protein n=2 Tax=Bremerella cremea TaxID=1031537 RepID=A0A368KW79_9BACT|nr:hypothetical protein DTL42_07200 [Bremerella cremea]
MILPISFGRALAVLAVLVFGSLPAHTVAADDVSNALSALGTGYDTNRRAFDNVICHYQVIQGKSSRDVAEIRKNGPDKALANLNCTWAASGDNVRLTKVPESKNGSPYDLSGAYLANRRFQLSFHGEMGAGSIHSPDNPAQGYEGTPFDMGIFAQNEVLSPGALISANRKASTKTLRYDGEVEEDGMRLEKFTHVNQGSDQREHFNWEYLLDPMRGYLPVRVRLQERKTGNVTLEAYIEEIEEIEAGVFFPMKSTVVTYFQNKDGSVSKQKLVRQFVVKDIAIRTPSEKELSLDLPRGAIVNDNIDGNSQLVFQKPRSFHVSDLERLYHETRQAILRGRLF